MTNPIATDLERIFKYQTCQWSGCVVLSAINEIEVLTLERDKARCERDELRQQVEDLKNGFEGSCYACEPVGEMNKRLQQERDEARKEICELRMPCEGSQRGYAKGRGWDCYKETP